MSKITENDPKDALLLLSSRDAGKRDIKDFLNLGNGRASSSILAKIMKRIRHPENYTDGRLTAKARTVGILLLAVLVLFFVLLGITSARLTRELIFGREPRTVLGTGETAELPRGITVYAKPHIDGAIENVLVKSSALYNIEYKTDDGTFYYTQKPLTAPDSEGDTDEPDGEMAENSDLCVILGENIGYVTVSEGEISKEISLYFEDGKSAFAIFGAKTIERAVEIALSVRAE